MKNLKKLLVLVLLLCACFVYTGKVSAATLKAPKVTLTKESEYEYGTIDVAYVKNASIYEVQRSTNKKSWKKIGILHVEGTYTDYEGVPNTLYYYRARACDLNDKCGKWSNVVSKKATLNVPKDFHVSELGSYINFYWTGDGNATSYQVQKSTDGKKWSKSTTADYSYYFDKKVELDKKYYYRVRSYKKVENKKYYSKWSTTFKVLNIIPKIKNLRYEATDNGIVLKWSGTKNGKIEILRSTSKNGKYENISKDKYVWSYSNSSDDTTEEEYLDSGLKENTTYYYKVRALYTVDKKEKKSKQVKIETKTLTLSKAKKLAAKKAKEYASKVYSDGSGASYSKKGLIELLKYNGFSAKAAKKGVENAKINYKQQALNYAKTSNYSEKKLREALLEKGFSEKEADYAIKNAKLDYNANARTYDRNTLEYYGISKTNLSSILKEALFTKKQVNNGTKNVNYKLQALLKVKDIMSYSLFGKNGLINYLVESCGFTKDEANYGVNNTKIDYVGLAVKYVKENWKNNEYYDYGRSYFEDLLSDDYHKFSKKDSKKILDQVNINYNKKALIAAKSFMNAEYNTKSEGYLKSSLVSRGFTDENIAYAMENGKFDFNNEALKEANKLAQEGFKRGDIELNLNNYNFSKESIVYAMKNVNAEYMKQNAVNDALMVYSWCESRVDLKKELMGNIYKYTEAEADYAINNAGIDFRNMLYQALYNEIVDGTISNYKSLDECKKVYVNDLKYTESEFNDVAQQLDLASHFLV